MGWASVDKEKFDSKPKTAMKHSVSKSIGPDMKMSLSTIPKGDDSDDNPQPTYEFKSVSLYCCGLSWFIQLMVADSQMCRLKGIVEIILMTPFSW